MMNLYHHLQRQAAFSRATFGPGARTNGVSDHIRKELVEVANAASAAERSKEWVDVAILGLDGLLRSCREQLSGPNTGVPNNSEIAEMACRLIREKQEENEMRDWPDWRTMDADKALNTTAQKKLSKGPKNMKCSDCAHWEKPDDQFDETWRADFGRCRHTPHGPDLGEWDGNGDWAMDAAHADRTAVVQDASGYSATLHTKPEHFCSMFTGVE